MKWQLQWVMILNQRSLQITIAIIRLAIYEIKIEIMLN